MENDELCPWTGGAQTPVQGQTAALPAVPSPLPVQVRPSVWLRRDSRAGCAPGRASGWGQPALLRSVPGQGSGRPLFRDRAPSFSTLPLKEPASGWGQPAALRSVPSPLPARARVRSQEEPPSQEELACSSQQRQIRGKTKL